MQDGQVTVDRETYVLPKPFMVIATQNPVEFRGTYALPESQLDRFMMKIHMGYPTASEELRILQMRSAKPATLHFEPVMNISKVIDIQNYVREVKVETVAKFMLDIISSTRNSREIDLGVSPRGSVALYRLPSSCGSAWEKFRYSGRRQETLRVVVSAASCWTRATGPSKAVARSRQKKIWCKK